MVRMVEVGQSSALRALASTLSTTHRKPFRFKTVQILGVQGLGICVCGVWLNPKP